MDELSKYKNNRQKQSNVWNLVNCKFKKYICRLSHVKVFPIYNINCVKKTEMGNFLLE